MLRFKEAYEEFEKYLPYLFAYSLGVMHNFLLKWVEDDMPNDHKEFIDILHKCFQSANI